MKTHDHERTAAKSHALHQGAGQPPAYEPGLTAEAPARAAAYRQTTQPERAVMHPERHDPDWRYYHAAGVG